VKSASQIDTSHKNISYTTIAVVVLVVLSFIGARFWQLSGWWLVVVFAVLASTLLLLASYKDRQDIKAIMRPMALGFILLGLRLLGLHNSSYGFVGGAMLLIGGVMGGYILAEAKKRKTS
jgi:hypothetical protein